MVTASSHGGGVGRRVDRHLRRLLQRHGVHVAALNLAADLRQLPVVERLDRDAASAASRAVAASRRQQERAAAVVEKPLRPAAALERAEGEAVGLEVIGLGVVHRDEQPGRRRRPSGPSEAAGESATSPPRLRETNSRRFMSWAPLPRASSSRAPGLGNQRALGIGQNQMLQQRHRFAPAAAGRSSSSASASSAAGRRRRGLRGRGGPEQPLGLGRLPGCRQRAARPAD